MATLAASRECSTKQNRPASRTSRSQITAWRHSTSPGAQIWSRQYLCDEIWLFLSAHTGELIRSELKFVFGGGPAYAADEINTSSRFDAGVNAGPQNEARLKFDGSRHLNMTGVVCTFCIGLPSCPWETSTEESALLIRVSSVFCGP